MISELPRPGSVWRHRRENYQTRVITSHATDIIAHNCEDAASPHKPMLSWRGDITAFLQTFQPGNPEKYPKTAH